MQILGSATLSLLHFEILADFAEVALPTLANSINWEGLIERENKLIFTKASSVLNYSSASPSMHFCVYSLNYVCSGGAPPPLL